MSSASVSVAPVRQRVARPARGVEKRGSTRQRPRSQGRRRGTKGGQVLVKLGRPITAHQDQHAIAGQELGILTRFEGRAGTAVCSTRAPAARTILTRKNAQPMSRI